MRWPRVFALLCLFCCVTADALVAGNRPISVSGPVDFAGLNEVITSHMDRVGATAASLVIVRDEALLTSRQFGWANRAGTIPVREEHLFRLASNTKPFTSALVRSLIEEGTLKESDLVVDVLKLTPSGEDFNDPRWRLITVGHLLEHKGGWDRNETFDPLYRLTEVRREVARRGAVRPDHVIEYMTRRPLQFAPGDRFAYSNLGYVILGRVTEEVTGKPFIDALNERIARPIGITDLRLTARTERRRPKLEVQYPKQTNREIRVRVASGGLVCSPRSMTRFLQHYWIVGGKRPAIGRGYWYVHYGSLPGTTLSWMDQRKDGVCWALAMNARNDETFNEDLKQVRDDVNKLIDDWRADGAMP